MITRQEMQKVEQGLRDEVIRLLTETTESYDSIARATGYSASRVYGIARERGIRRFADKKTEVANG